VIDIHTRIRTFTKLERLKRANGTTANEVNWLTPRLAPTGVNIPQLALRAHNEWLENIAADGSDLPYAEKVIRNKPSWAKDACWEANGTKHEETFTLTGPSVCNTLFPINSTVRLEAGPRRRAHARRRSGDHDRPLLRHVLGASLPLDR